MITNTTQFLSTMLRIAVVSTMFIGPVAGFIASLEGPGAGVKGAGLVLFVSLQRNRLRCFEALPNFDTGRFHDTLARL